MGWIFAANRVRHSTETAIMTSVRPQAGRDKTPPSQATLYRVTQKKREILKNPTKIEEIQEKNSLIEIEPLQLAF